MQDYQLFPHGMGRYRSIIYILYEKDMAVIGKTDSYIGSYTSQL